jgi:hypothetical protein
MIFSTEVALPESLDSILKAVDLVSQSMLI